MVIKTLVIEKQVFWCKIRVYALSVAHDCSPWKISRTMILRFFSMHRLHSTAICLGIHESTKTRQFQRNSRPYHHWASMAVIELCQPRGMFTLCCGCSRTRQWNEKVLSQGGSVWVFSEDTTILKGICEIEGAAGGIDVGSFLLRLHQVRRPRWWK